MGGEGSQGPVMRRSPDEGEKGFWEEGGLPAMGAGLPAEGDPTGTDRPGEALSSYPRSVGYVGKLKRTVVGL